MMSTRREMWNQVRADDEGKSHRVNDTHMNAF